MKVCAVIPVRYGSSRFPGKPLALIGGLPMIQHVWTETQTSQVFHSVIIATDDQRIAETARQFGAQIELTSPLCQSGTDRVAEVAQRHPEMDVFINVQGDEPFIAPQSLQSLVGVFNDKTVQMATLVRPLLTSERSNPNVVKVVLSLNNNALYFSRADIPFLRESEGSPSDDVTPRFAHVGVYGYRRQTLLRLSTFPATPLEVSEKLEQLRALQNEIQIRCAFTQSSSLGVDTPEDLEKAEALWRSRG